MAYEPRRTLLIGLSALAVVFAAALFPAAGVGTHPGGSVGVADPEPTAPPDDPTPTEADDRMAPATETPTPTPTPAPPSDDDGGELFGDLFEGLSLGLGSLLGGLAQAVGWLLVGVAFAGVALVLRGAQPGTPRVELPYGLTITLPFTIPAWVGGFSTRVSRLTMGFVVSVSASVTQLLDAAAAAGRAAASGLGIVAGEGLRGSLSLLGALPAALSGALAGLATLPTAIASLPGALSTVGSSVGAEPDRPEEDARDLAPDPVETDEPDESGPPTVEEAWVAMTDLLPVERGPTTTPAEFARRAIDRGVPAEPVRRLTRAFEDVAYGGYDPREHASTARDSLASLRDRLGGDGT